MKIVSKEYLGERPVYDIGVSSITNSNNFILKNGIVASNCFNKAHSISYSLITYISAYLKTHYPVEFFASLMSTRSKTLQPKSWAVKAPEYINEAEKFNVKVLPPSVNQSSYEFTVIGNEIYFGLNAIRDVGKTSAKAIIKARQKTSFKDIKDFLNRINLQKVNTKTFEALTKAGAFDSMGYSRQNLLENVNSIYSYFRDIDDYNKRKIDISSRELHNNKVLPLIERRNFLRKEVKKITRKIEKEKVSEEERNIYPYHLDELEKLEDQNLKKLPALKPKEEPIFPTLVRNIYVEITLKQVMEQAYYIGCYLGGHPITMLDITKTDLCDLTQGQQSVDVAGVVLSYKQIVTRKGQKMAFLEIDDSTGSAEVVLFPYLYAKYSKLEIKDGDLLLLNVKVDSTDPQIKLIPNKINKYRIKDEMDS
jgi:DNA polymerase-3 subunit alpha